jgi:hypothetical protein
MKDSDLVGITAAARAIKMPPSLFTYYVLGGRGPEFLEVGGRKYFKISDILAWRPKKMTVGRKPNNTYPDVADENRT